MSTRALVVLAVLAAAAVVGVAVTRQPMVDPAPEPTSGERLVPWLEERVNDVSAVRVRGAGGHLIAHPVRRDEGWRVRNRAGYPADAETLRATLIGIARARRLEPKTERPDAYARLGVAPIDEAQGKAVEIALQGLDRDLAVLVGKPSAGDVGGTYVRVVNEPRAWLVSGGIERFHRVSDWLDDRLVDIPAARVRRVRIDAVDGEPVEVRHEAPAADFVLDTPPGRRPLSNSIAKSLARIVADLRLDDVMPADEAPDRPRLALARFETFSGLVIEIEAFGERGDDGAASYVRLHAGAEAGAAEAVRDRVRTLNARYEGWRYRIPGYKLFNATQTLEGVLESP